MKRLSLPLLAALVLSLVLVACGEDAEPQLVTVEKVVTVVVPGETVVKTVVETVQIPGPVVERVVVERVEVPAGEFRGTLVVAASTIPPPLFLPSETAFAAQFFNSASGMFEGMVRLGYVPAPDTGPRSGDGIASSWDLASDESKLTFKIRDGVQFHKGWGELTAEDVAWSFNNSIQEGSTFARVDNLRRFIDRAEALDKNTLVIHVKEGLLSPLWFDRFTNSPHMASKKVFDEKGDGAITTMAATGPFNATIWRGDDEVRAEAVLDHWRAPPNIEELRWVALPETSTQLAAFQTGEAHVIRPPLAFLKETLELPRSWKARLSKGNGQSIVFGGNYWADVWRENGENIFPRDGFKPDEDHPWIGDPTGPGCDKANLFNVVVPPAKPACASMENARKVRWALAMAIDRDTVNTVALDGFGAPKSINSNVAFPGDSLYLDEWTIPFDVEGAKKLLAEAGYPNCFEMGFWIPPLPGLNQEVAMAAAQMLQTNLGCKINIERTAYSVGRPKLVARDRDQPWFMWGGGGNDPWSTGMWVSHFPNAGFNYGVENPNPVEELWWANHTGTREQVIEANVALQSWNSYWRTMSPLVHMTEWTVLRPEVVQWLPTSSGYIFTDPETVIMAPR